MNDGGIKKTTVCLKERTEVHQLHQFVTLYQQMNKIQEVAQKKTTACRNEREYNYQNPCQNVNDNKQKEQGMN